jgi:hypothetical protein
LKAPRAPTLLLGFGLGGFIDGILLHQVLQWHHMLTSTSGNPMTTVAGLEANTLGSGALRTHDGQRSGPPRRVRSRQRSRRRPGVRSIAPTAPQQRRCAPIWLCTD